MKLVAFTVQLTSSFVVGELVPIPTFAQLPYIFDNLAFISLNHSIPKVSHELYVQVIEVIFAA
jgi:hypothetical protein